MATKLKDNISSQYIKAANALKGKNARRRIVAYVESYDDVYFWRTVLSQFEDDRRYFEVMLPSKDKLSRGKRQVLLNFMGKKKKDGDETDNGVLGENMIACVDADYDVLLQGKTRESKMIVSCPYVFHTYVYAIENYQCYAPSLHDVAVAVTLNDHRIFDFREFFEAFSVAVFPLFVWNVWAYRTDHFQEFTMTDFNRVTEVGGFSLQDPEPCLKNLRRKVGVKIRALQKQFPGNKEAYLNLKAELLRLGITPETTYLYIQGHHLFDTIASPILQKVCRQLWMERQREIQHASAHSTQKRNELTCYENSRQDVKTMMKKTTGYQQCPQYRRLLDDIRNYLNNETSS